MKWNANNATITVDTDREGALAAKGHRLRFNFEAFEIGFDPKTSDWNVVIDMSSIFCAGTIDDGELNQSGISEKDRDKILSTTITKVLDVNHHRYARFEAKLDALSDHGSVDGKITICGVTRPFTATYQLDDQTKKTYVSQFTLNQTDFNIKPYSVLMGALRVSDALQVRVSIEKIES